LGHRWIVARVLEEAEQKAHEKLKVDKSEISLCQDDVLDIHHRGIIPEMRI
jgi:hypothetical protein